MVGAACLEHMNYSLNSLKGGYMGNYVGTTIGVIKGDTRSLAPPAPSARAPQALAHNAVRVPRASAD